jgi:glycerol-3-phosphate O-acyltransferase / dihydroxyacetone phosphate acyltransferase
MALYRTVRAILRFILGLFFRRVAVVGDEQTPVDGDGAVIFAGNHPNSLIDPALIIAFSNRIVHFAAKDVLFESALLRPILLALGAVPIARKKDHNDGKLDNAGAFDRLFTVLAGGRAIGIFPEGISHDLSQLQPMKTGAARIAFGVAKKFRDTKVRIVPSGLNYGRPKRFRSSVLVQFGAPIEIDESWLRRHDEDDRKAVRELTDLIEGHMRALTVNADDWQTIRVLDALRRIYQPPGISLEARVELSRRFNAEYPKVAAQPEVKVLYAAVADYQARLDAIGLRDSDLLRDFSVAEIFARFYVQVGRIVLWLPLGVPGFALHAPLAMLVSWLGVRFSPRKDVIGTSKLVAGFVLALLIYLAVGVLTMQLYDWQIAALVTAGLPASGYATLRILERYVSARGVFISTLRFARFRQEVANLRRERSRLEYAVITAVETLLPDNIDPLFLNAGKARIGAS